MHILVVNDDGIKAEGIRILATKLKKLGKVTVVSPKEHMSGAGHSLTINKVVKVEKIDNYLEDVQAWAVYGTPRDCTELGIRALVDEPIDLIVSGINEGSNLSNNAVCSGTCGAACAGLDFHVPAIAVSLDFGKEYNYEIAGDVALEMAQWFMQQDFKYDFALNVNVPNLPKEQIKGYQATGFGGLYVFNQKQGLEFDGQYYYYDTNCLSMDCIETIDDISADIYAVNNGYISVSPMDLDIIKYEAIGKLKGNLPTLK